MKIRFLTSIILSLLVFVGCDKKTKTNINSSSLKKVFLSDGDYSLNIKKSKMNWWEKNFQLKLIQVP